MLLAFRHIDELGQVAVSVQADVQLYGPFLLSVSGPGESLQAEIDGRGVQQIDFLFDLDRCFGATAMGGADWRVKRGADRAPWGQLRQPLNRRCRRIFI